jgi:hypothetical protein
VINILRLIKVRQEYATPPVSVEDLKLYLQVEGTAYDSQFLAYIWTATDQVEQYTRKSLAANTVYCTFEQKADSVLLPFSPLDEVVSAFWKKCPLQMISATYQIINEGEPDAEFAGEDGKGSFAWPTYRVEYTTTADPSLALKEAVKIQAGYLWQNRDTTNPGWSPAAKAIVNANKRIV